MMTHDDSSESELACRQLESTVRGWIRKLSSSADCAAAASAAFSWAFASLSAALELGFVLPRDCTRLTL